MVRDTSVAVSNARSETPGCGIGWGVSMLICRCVLEAMASATDAVDGEQRPFGGNAAGAILFRSRCGSLLSTWV